MKFPRNALSLPERAFRFSRPVRFCKFEIVALLCVLVLLLAGCGRSGPRADIVIINGGEAESLDPAIVTGQLDGRLVLTLFEGLTRFDPLTGKAVAGIAERWAISPDGREYTFYLRSNAVWSTGEPITARDFVDSWLRVLDPATASDYAGQLFFLENAEEYNSGKIKDRSTVGVHAVNDRTLRVNLKSPCPFFVDLCAFYTLVVVPRKAIETHGDRWIMQRPLPVSGAYLLEDWRIHDKLRVRKNPRYWDAANTRTELVDFLPVESATVAMNLYESGQADIIWDKNVIPMELMDILVKRRDCHTFPYLGSYFFRINVTRKPLTDVRVRKALALTVDKNRLVEKLLRAGEKPANHVTPTGTANYDPPEGLGYDPREARRLLAEAGFPRGKGFPTLQYLSNPGKQHEQIAIEMREMWQKELGIRVELRQVEWKVYLAAQSSLDYDLTRSSWIADYDDPNTFLDMWMSNNGNNRTGWKNANYDELMLRGNSQVDLKMRAKLLRDAESLLLRDGVPVVPLYFYVGISFYDPVKIDGIGLNMLDEHPVSAIGRVARR